MKNYIATVTAHGGFFRGQKQKFAVGPITAKDKLDAARIALDMVEADKTVTDYEKLTCPASSVKTTTLKS